MAGEYDFTIEQGATFNRVMTWKPDGSTAANLTGYTARMMIRDEIDDAEALIELTTENDRITLGGAAGTITLYISSTDTEALTFDTGVYDLELIAPTLIDGEEDVTRLLMGAVTLSKEVTRDDS